MPEIAPTLNREAMTCEATGIEAGPVDEDFVGWRSKVVGEAEPSPTESVCLALLVRFVNGNLPPQGSAPSTPPHPRRGSVSIC
jgi:hypothetical protein